MEFQLIKAILSNGGPILIAIVFMFMMWMKDRKHTVTNNELLKEIKLIKGNQYSMIGTIDKTWEAHDKKDEDGVYVWHLRPSWLRQQEEIKIVLTDLKEVIKDVHNGQKQQTEVLKALVDKINK